MAGKFAWQVTAESSKWVSRIPILSNTNHSFYFHNFFVKSTDINLREHNLTQDIYSFSSESDQSQRTLTRMSIISASPDQISSQLGDESVILNVKTGLYFGLNEVGSRVWSITQKSNRNRQSFGGKPFHSANPSLGGAGNQPFCAGVALSVPGHHCAGSFGP